MDGYSADRVIFHAIPKIHFVFFLVTSCKSIDALTRTCVIIVSVFVSTVLWCAVSVVEFVIQHHRNAAQLAPVVRADTAGFHGHREEGGRGVLLPSHI